MPIVSLFCASHCHGDEIADQISQNFGCDCIDNEILELASSRFNVDCHKLLRSIHGPTSIFNNITRERELCIEYIRIAFAEKLKQGDFIYSGFAGHLVSDKVKNILRVGIIANNDYRIRQAVKHDGLSEKEALHRIEVDNKQRFEWTNYLYNSNPWNQALYDVKIPIHIMPVDRAVELICQQAENPVLESSENVMQDIDDQITKSKVKILLISKGYNVDVSCVDGMVTVLVNKFTLRLERLKNKVAKLVQSSLGIEDVEIRAGSGFNRPRISPYDFELPSKASPGDDEKEYVLTISKRLQDFEYDHFFEEVESALL